MTETPEQVRAVPKLSWYHGEAVVTPSLGHVLKGAMLTKLKGIMSPLSSLVQLQQNLKRLRGALSNRFSARSGHWIPFWLPRPTL